MRVIKWSLVALIFLSLWSRESEAGLFHSCKTWQRVDFRSANLDRHVLWKGPEGAWRGAVVVLHGGGGEAAHFCSGGRLVNPQINFAKSAIDQGFAVFLLDATTDKVADDQGRPCGKRFDFSILPRANIDLPYIKTVLENLVPSVRPQGSNKSVFMTGLSTGGYMTTHAATHFSPLVTAFAPISAGDPYGTDTICDTSLSVRKSAKGILVDRETRKEIVERDACLSHGYPNESPWPQKESKKPTRFKQFQHEDDGIVDFSCAKKANLTLRRNGYTDAGAYVVKGEGKKNAFKHLWLDEYNQPLLDFFAKESLKAVR